MRIEILLFKYKMDNIGRDILPYFVSAYRSTIFCHLARYLLNMRRHLNLKQK